ncbi:hypothetical protein BSL78_19788 [Apostichopus japonicus]|uniref:Core-binding (CB) domain-containing protein n=1 Tax=Stichopus japonicus TaxID=307972 RepID=A0A2G8K5R3_STIJA|nr:hypothetical protein BSL78_19788 [Apostichopus japonicus]
MGVGRVLNQLGGGWRRTSPPLPHTESAAQTEPILDKATVNRALLAGKTVVPDFSRPSSSNPTQSSRLTPLSELGPGPSQSTSPTVPEPDCVAVVRARFRASGSPSDAAAMPASARRPSTVHTYNSRLARFFEWCSRLQIRPDTTSPAQLADFCMLLFEEGKQPNTIRNYRSAIATIHSGFPVGSSVGTCPGLAVLLEGMANRRPIRCKLLPAWSINGGLHHLARSPFEPMGSSLLRDLAIKTLFLVAAASARRRSCLHALSTAEGHIRFDSRGVRLVPDPKFLAKNQTLAFIPGDIFLAKLSLPPTLRRTNCGARYLTNVIKCQELSENQHDVILKLVRTNIMQNCLLVIVLLMYQQQASVRGTTLRPLDLTASLHTSSGRGGRGPVLICIPRRPALPGRSRQEGVTLDLHMVG